MDGAVTQVVMEHYPSENGNSNLDGPRDIIAGMISGFVCKAFEYPFDTIKVLQQTGGSKYSGPVDCAQKAVKEGGALALYRGLASPLLGSMVECGTIFLAYGYIKKAVGVTALEQKGELVPISQTILCGAGAGVVSAFVLTPVELIKCRIQVSGPGTGRKVLYNGPVDCIKKSIKADGFAGLWKGNIACLGREIPGNMAWFGMYEYVLQKLFNYSDGAYKDKKDVPLSYHALGGAFAGVAYWGIPYPFDTIKSKQQTDSRFMGKSMSHIAQTIFREEGLGGMYKGVGVTCARAAPSHALIFVIYALADNMIRKYWF